MDPAISVVIVAFNSGPDLARTLPALARELGPDDEVILVDNGSDGSAGPLLAEHLPRARLERNRENRGFAAAVNQGASLARKDLLLILNPDAVPLPGFGRAIRAPAVERPEWHAWMGLVACRIAGELRINSAGNPIHFTGITWAGNHGQNIATESANREVPTGSGACLAVRREVWSTSGGFASEYFLYHEDVDLSLRIRAAGGRIGIAPEAVVEHDYEFESGPQKWFWLERNRIATVIRNYPTPVLAFALPVLLLSEPVLLLVAIRAGWGSRKLRSWRDLVHWTPRLLAERRTLGRRRHISAAEFAAILTPDLDSPQMPAVVRRGPIRWLLRGWWWLALTLLRRSG